MNITILSGGTGWHVQDLLRAARDLGHTADVLDYRCLFATPFSSAPLGNSDALVLRTMPAGSLEQVVFRMDLLLQAFTNKRYMLNPPRAVETCVDKYLTDVRLHEANLPTPLTVVCQNTEDAMAAFESLGRNVVVKPLFGSEGRGMMRVDNHELAWRTFRAIEQTGGVLYLQEFVDHEGWDARIFVLNQRPLAAMVRRNSMDWRTNVAQGGTTERYEPPADVVDLALRASAATGAIVAGVDLIQDRLGEWLVVEVNAVPGWRALSATCNIDIATEIVQFIASECNP